MRKLLVLLTVVLLAVSGIAFADVTGNWSLIYEGPMGPEEWKMNLKGDGTVDCEHFMLGPIKGTHKCTADKWDVYFKEDTPMGEMEFKFLGTISGSSAKGNLDLMGTEIPWEATKK